MKKRHEFCGVQTNQNGCPRERQRFPKWRLQWRKQEWKEILNGTPEDRRTHVYVWPSAKASMEPMRIIK